MIPKKYQVIVFLVLITVIMMVMKILYGYKGENKIVDKQTQIIPTPAPEPTPTPNEYPIQAQLPYQGKGFVVESYVAPMTLKVVLNKVSTSSATKAINIWLESLGDVGSGHIVEFEKGN